LHVVVVAVVFVVAVVVVAAFLLFAVGFNERKSLANIQLLYTALKRSQ